MNWDFKVVADVITALAALVAAVKSWMAHKESEETRRLTAEIRTDIKTEIKTTIATVLQQTQTHSQQVILNFPGSPPTVGQGQDVPMPIFRQQTQQEQVPQPQPPESQQPQQPEPPEEQQH